jgi:hypothetical protein
MLFGIARVGAVKFFRQTKKFAHDTFKNNNNYECIRY